MTDFERQETEGLRPDQIEREIEQTRERMTRDIDAIGEKLRPSNLAHEAMDSVGERARRTGSRLVDFVRDNPFPVAAVGLGVTWWMSSRSQSTLSGDRMARYAYTGPERRGEGRDRRGVGARIGHMAGSARESVSNAASTTRDAVSSAAGTIAERAGDLGSEAKTRMQDLGTGARHRAEENPLAVVAGAAIIGLAIGLLMPETRRENEMMGRARDRLADRAGDAVVKAADATADAADSVKETLKSEMSERGPEVKEMAQDIARRVKDTVKESAGRVKDEMRNT